MKQEVTSLNQNIVPMYPTLKALDVDALAPGSLDRVFILFLIDVLYGGCLQLLPRGAS